MRAPPLACPGVGDGVGRRIAGDVQEEGVKELRRRSLSRPGLRPTLGSGGDRIVRVLG
jgi:hypothetical protein